MFAYRWAFNPRSSNNSESGFYARLRLQQHSSHRAYAGSGDIAAVTAAVVEVLVMLGKVQP
jgi:hypothetical protein